MRSTTIEANDIGGAQFMIRPKSLGVTPIKITARSTRMADAVIKDLLVEPEGVEVEIVDKSGDAGVGGVCADPLQ